VDTKFALLWIQLGVLLYAAPWTVRYIMRTATRV
jgi:hypothetical protein